jgi:hypothetical protein
VSDRDLVWFGRAGVWIGVSLLLLMAFSGAQVAFVTVFAVFIIIVGVALLIYAIPLGRQVRMPKLSQSEARDHE